LTARGGRMRVCSAQLEWSGGSPFGARSAGRSGRLIEFVRNNEMQRVTIFGYIDPGAGSLIIQALIAGALAVPFLVRNKLRAVMARLRREPMDSSETAGSDRR
jgi:hypothetical protein